MHVSKNPNVSNPTVCVSGCVFASTRYTELLKSHLCVLSKLSGSPERNSSTLWPHWTRCTHCQCTPGMCWQLWPSQPQRTCLQHSLSMQSLRCLKSTCRRHRLRTTSGSSQSKCLPRKKCMTRRPLQICIPTSTGGTQPCRWLLLASTCQGHTASSCWSTLRSSQGHRLCSWPGP